jgi:hypothetical protein
MLIKLATMINLTKDIHSLTEFKRNPTSYLIILGNPSVGFPYVNEEHLTLYSQKIKHCLR